MEWSDGEGWKDILCTKHNLYCNFNCGNGWIRNCHLSHFIMHDFRTITDINHLRISILSEYAGVGFASQLKSDLLTFNIESKDALAWAWCYLTIMETVVVPWKIEIVMYWIVSIKLDMFRCIAHEISVGSLLSTIIILTLVIYFSHSHPLRWIWIMVRWGSHHQTLTTSIQISIFTKA